jgi:hypothetical protein
MQRAAKESQRAAWALVVVLAFLMLGCGGSLYKVKPKIDAPVTGGKEAGAGGFLVRAVPLTADEESQELFQANLPLGGLLPVLSRRRRKKPSAAHAALS